MAVTVRVRGGMQVKRNVANAVRNIQRQLRAEMKVAGYYLIAKADPLTPFDTGNLLGSYYTDVEGSNVRPVLIVGNNANYAIFVHEDMTSDFARGGPKFLERAVNDNIQTVLRFFRRAIEKGGGGRR